MHAHTVTYAYTHVSVRAHTHTHIVSFCCLMSMEARRPIRDGDEWEKGE